MHSSEEEFQSLDDAQGQLEQQTALCKELEQRELDLKALIGSYREYDAGQRSLAGKQADFSGLTETYQKAKTGYDQAEAYFFSAQAGILAGRLLPGKPCPVCGSREHPVPAELPSTAPSQAELEQFKTKRDEWNARCTAAGQELEKCRAAVETAGKEIVRRCSALSLESDREALEQALKINTEQKRNAEQAGQLASIRSQRRRAVAVLLTDQRKEWQTAGQVLSAWQDQRTQQLAEYSAAQAEARALASSLTAGAPALGQAEGGVGGV